MLPHQERVVQEKEELDNKRQKLYDFFHSDTFKNLDEEEQKRLEKQSYIMAQYTDILTERIKAFK